MDENNQILDVTYGNFSCRLEGFEDSVETMKTVVSFFHDLAGHERFMDVPPLAPDMDTLARLTEEQSGQPVEIEGEGHQVSLRARADDVEDDLMDDVAALEDEQDDEEKIVAATDDADVSEEIEDDADLQAEAAEDAEAEDDYDVEASVADKLERIRAVVDGGTAADEDDFAEDLADDMTAATAAAANPLSQRLAELAQRNNDVIAQDEADDADTDAALRDAFEDTAEELSDDTADTLEDHVEDDALGGMDADDDAPLETLAEADEDAFAFETSTDSATDAPDEAVEDIADADDVADVEEALTEDLPVEEEEVAAATPDDAQEPDRSPLVLTPNDAAAASDDATKDDEDEFDLQKEVAKVEAEIAARQQNGMDRHGLPRSVEDAMSRIMSQTDQHLNQPESRRHRDAFAQLKAAVAATEAARQLGDKGAETPDPDEVFKDDLGAHDAEEKVKSQAIASAPLKLVPSQKVDPETDTAADAEKSSAVKTRFIEPVTDDAPAQEPPAAASSKPLDAASERLRQIAAQKEADGQAETTAGFAEFAAAHGATDLADRLEAAAAFICFVEGAADFSRPQVMKVVQSASKEEITREDGLRCFGRLLRQARLIKLPNGRFQVAENTQYRPDGDKAAQG